MKNSISINLLPREILEENKRTTQKPWLNRASIALIALSIVVTVGVFVFRLTQGLNINSTKQTVQELETKIGSLKEKEGLVTVLKTRLEKINTLSSQDSIHTQSFLTVVALMPPQVTLTSLNVAKGDRVTITGETNSTTLLESFFNNLLNEPGKVSAVKLESLSRTQKGSLRFDINFTLITKKGST